MKRVSEEGLLKVRRLKDLKSGSLKAPLFIAWQLTSECNLGCLHCCEESGTALADEMQGDEIFDFCRQIADLEIPYVAISGGEPLLCPDFFKVCGFLIDRNISVKVETNGLFIDKEVAKRMAKLGFRSVQVSVDGASPVTHKKLRGGDWHQTINACKYLVAEGVNTEIVFVPTKFNFSEVGEMIDLAASLGAYGLYTGKIMRIGRAAINWSILCPSDDEYKEFFRILEKKTEEYKGKMKVYYYPYDVVEELKYRLKYPAASLLVVPNGKVKLIGTLPFICGELRKHSLLQIWQNYKKAWRVPEVIRYTNRVVADPSLLADSNKWIELY